MFFYPNYGPTFGHPQDLCIWKKDSNTNSSQLGNTYDNLGITKDLIGEGNRLIEEIEVFTVVK